MVLVAEQCHVAVYLVTYHNQVVRHGEVCQPLQCLLRPHDAYRVVRIGKHKHTAVVVAHLFQVVEVHVVAGQFSPVVTYLLQRVPHHLMPDGLRHEVERMVDGWLHDDLVAFLQQGTHRHPDALHYSRNVAQPVLLHVPLVAVMYPPCNHPPIVARHLRVAEQRVVQSCTQCVGDEPWGLPLHVSYPHGGEVFSSESLLKPFMLDVARP